MMPVKRLRVDIVWVRENSGSTAIRISKDHWLPGSEQKYVKISVIIIINYSRLHII